MNIAKLLSEFYKDYLYTVNGIETIWTKSLLRHHGFCALFHNWVYFKYPELSFMQKDTLIKKLKQRQHLLFALSFKHPVIPFGLRGGITDERMQWAESRNSQKSCENLFGRIKYLFKGK